MEYFKNQTLGRVGHIPLNVFCKLVTVSTKDDHDKKRYNISRSFDSLVCHFILLLEPLAKVTGKRALRVRTVFATDVIDGKSFSEVPIDGAKSFVKNPRKIIKRDDMVSNLSFQKSSVRVDKSIFQNDRGTNKYA